MHQSTVVRAAGATPLLSAAQAPVSNVVRMPRRLAPRTAPRSALGPFRSSFAETIFRNKYQHEGCETWEALARTLVEDVCRSTLPREEKEELVRLVAEMKVIPGGRYLYYAGRPIKAFNNCFILLSEEDSREDWANLSWKAESCLMTGGGIGNDYSVYRPKGAKLNRTGGTASGPLSKAKMINEIGREVHQGGSRRSAIYGSLNWAHADAMDWVHAKDWHSLSVAGTGMTVWDLKQHDFNYPAPLDMTNISLNYDNAWRDGNRLNDVFMANVRQALKTGEPGFSFNFDDKEKETGRNACTEVTSDTDSDVCNLASVNLARIEDLDELRRAVYLTGRFLVCGTLVADLPYEKVRLVREQNRRLGLGLMGVHEWLISRGYRYEVVPELHEWLAVYRAESERGANDLCDRLGISRPRGYRAIAPTGTIAILAGTSSGIEPLFAVAYKRRYLIGGTDWAYQYVVDSAAQTVIDMYGVDPDSIESALDLAADYERRIRVQADIQDYVDMSIASTINLPSWGSDLNNEDKVEDFARTLAVHAPRLRGFTCYPDGSRGGQPLTRVDYKTAAENVGTEFMEHDICVIGGRGGSCGV